MIADVYEHIAHTADVRFRVTSESLEGLFRDALRALTDFMQPALSESPASASLELDAPDTTSLLVDFLSEALTLSHVRREAYTEVTFTALDATSLRATLTGHRVRSFSEDVKAVTYHEADVVQRGDEWSTMLVFDI